MLLMILGGVLVGGLVVWALTRTVEPATPAPAPVPVADATSGTFSPTATSPSTAPALPGQPAATSTSATPAPSPQGDRSEVTRIAAEDVRAKLSRGEIVVVDVRDPAAFSQSHIPGSINLPFATIEGQTDSLPKDKGIVTLCT